MGRPRASWLQQVDQHLKEMGMGQASVWGWPDRGPWSTGKKWTQRRTAPAHAPIPDLTFHSASCPSHFLFQKPIFPTLIASALVEKFFQSVPPKLSALAQLFGLCLPFHATNPTL